MILRISKISDLGKMCDLNGSDIKFNEAYEKNNGLLVTRNSRVSRAVLDALNIGV